MNIYPAYISKDNLNHENQIILLLIPNGKRIAISTIKKLSVLLRGITSKHNGDFYCLNCLHSFRIKKNLESHKTLRKKKDFCRIVMPSEDTQIIEFNQYQKSDKTPSFMLYRSLIFD